MGSVESAGSGVRIVLEDEHPAEPLRTELHYEGGVAPKHLAEGVVPTIPLRALIPKGSKNLLVAGRCLSSDQLANSALRVQASCMAMGQVAGVTAALAAQENSSPLQVPLTKIRSELVRHGAIVPKVG